MSFLFSNKCINTIFIINGESNSGSLGSNASALESELGERKSIKIFNPNTGLFEILNIGVNNNIGHLGQDNPTTTKNGLELGIANRTAVDPIYNGQALMIKTGAGGATIEQLVSPYWSTFTSRVNTAKSIYDFNTLNKVILFSQGINDIGSAPSGTDTSGWQSGVVYHFEQMRDIVGVDTPIIMTRFNPSTFQALNEGILNICNTIDNVYSVSSEGAEMQDANHWSYAGLKLMASRILDKYSEIR